MSSCYGDKFTYLTNHTSSFAYHRRSRSTRITLQIAKPTQLSLRSRNSYPPRVSEPRAAALSTILSSLSAAVAAGPEVSAAVLNMPAAPGTASVATPAPVRMTQLRGAGAAAAAEIRCSAPSRGLGGPLEGHYEPL